jgi:hypothetical protein
MVEGLFHLSILHFSTLVFYFYYCCEVSLYVCVELVL